MMLIYAGITIPRKGKESVRNLHTPDVVATSTASSARRSVNASAKVQVSKRLEERCRCVGQLIRSLGK